MALALKRYLWRKTRMQFRKFGCFAHLRSMRVAFRSCSYLPRVKRTDVMGFHALAGSARRPPLGMLNRAVLVPALHEGADHGFWPLWIHVAARAL